MNNMSKGLKTALIVAIILLIVGIGIICVAFAVSGFDFDKLGNGPDRVEKNYECDVDDLTTFVINDQNNGFEIKKPDDEKIHIKYYESEKEYYSIDNSNGTLRIEYQSDLKWYEYFWFNLDFSNRKIVILLPSSYQGSITATTSNGGIDASDIALADYLKLSTSNGTITVKNVDTSEDVDINTSNEWINLYDFTADNIYCDTNNGTIKIDNVTVNDSFDVNTSNGGIDISKLKADKKIKLKTSNGSIKGDIFGDINDYQITSHTSNGQNNLPDNFNGGNIILDVKTSNGNIDINFE